MALLERGRLRESREMFWQQAETASANGDVEALAEAALGLGGIWVHEHRTTLDNARVEALQRQALEALPHDHALAPRLRMRLAAERAYRFGHGDDVFTELEHARAVGDAVGLAEALSLTHHCLLGPQHTAERAALAEELIAVSPATGRPLDGLVGLMWRTIDLLLAGDRRACRSLTELRDGLVATPCDALAFVVAAIDVMLATRQGRLDEADRLAAACYELGCDVGDADAFGWYGAHLVAIRWLQGRGNELLDLLDELVDSTTVAEPLPAFVAARATLAAASGDELRARAALACLRTADLAELTPSSGWAATMLAACEAAYLLDDADAAAEGYRLLAPFAELPVMAGIAVACYGSAHRPLGFAAATMGDVDAAVDHLERAVVAELARGGGPWHAIALAGLADVLDRRGGSGDGERAARARGAAVEEARSFGMHVRADEWARQGCSTTITCRRDGRVWVVRRGEREAAVPHGVGMQYLDHLLRHPDVDIAAVDLAGAASAPSGRDPVLDPRAKAAYRRRVEELQADLDDAERCSDLERVARTRLELDRYLEELARATGLGGRSRSFADAAERARVSVHKAIKRALAAITEAHPDLGRELASRVVTGTRCVYRAS